MASRYDEYVSVKDLSDKINRALTAAKKDNDFIYHDRVPEVKDLEHIGKAALVKATAITPPISQKFTGTIHRLSTCFLIVITLLVYTDRFSSKNSFMLDLVVHTESDSSCVKNEKEMFKICKHLPHLASCCMKREYLSASE